MPHLPRVFVIVALSFLASTSPAQTTAGSATAIVVPVTAQTASFTSEVTVYNPNAGPVTVDVAFYEANNSANPGLRTCADVVVQGGRSQQFTLAAQCTLGAGSHFGLLVLTSLSGSNPIYGYVRTQNPQGIGFSTEGFPAENFNNQVSHATGLKKTTAGLIYQTNCFVGSLSQPVNYTLKLFDGTTNAQIGSTINGALTAFQQVRYLDIFAAPPNGVGAPAGNQLNVRAEFASTNGALLVGFCTVQDNASFGADFRIAKSYGTTAAFVQGGNSFGATAILGTTDDETLDLRVNGSRALRLVPNPDSPLVIAGFAGNTGTVGGVTVGGGGSNGSVCPDPFAGTPTRACNNVGFGSYATVAGGRANEAGSLAVVSGGQSNSAIGFKSTVMGGEGNLASGLASIAAGSGNVATGDHAIALGTDTVAQGNFSVALGNRARNLGDGSFQFADSSPFDYTTSGINNFRVRATGGVRFTTGIDNTGATTWSCVTSDGNGWSCASDRNLKHSLVELDGETVLAKLVALPVYQWQPKGKNTHVKHYGPMAQDFMAAFGLGDDDKMIGMQDADGVALAAIQGLNAKLEQRLAEKDAQLVQQRREIEMLRERVARSEIAQVDLLQLRAMVQKLQRDRAIATR